MRVGSTTESRDVIAGSCQLMLVPTFVVVAVDATGMGIILPLLPFYSERLGATPFLLGALVSAYAACQLIAGPVVGMLSDRYGRRKVLVVSQIGTCVGFVLLALAGNLTLVFLARILDGLTSGNISVAHAYAAEHSAPSTRKQALGMTSGAIGTGLLVGPALSSVLVHYGETAPVWAASALSLISIVATIVLLPADPPASEPFRQQRVAEPKVGLTMSGMRYPGVCSACSSCSSSSTRCSCLRSACFCRRGFRGTDTPSAPANSAGCSPMPVSSIWSSRASLLPARTWSHPIAASLWRPLPAWDLVLPGWRPGAISPCSPWC
jgi:MFS family permease